MMAAIILIGAVTALAINERSMAVRDGFALRKVADQVGRARNEAHYVGARCAIRSLTPDLLRKAEDLGLILEKVDSNLVFEAGPPRAKGDSQ
jgi:hypothetical protein